MEFYAKKLGPSSMEYLILKESGSGWTAVRFTSERVISVSFGKLKFDVISPKWLKYKVTFRYMSNLLVALKFYDNFSELVPLIGEVLDEIT